MRLELSENQIILLCVGFFVFVGLITVFVITKAQNDVRDYSNKQIAEGKELELKNLEKLYNANTCEEKNLILIQEFSNRYWDKDVYDKAYQHYRIKCIP